MLNYVGVQSDLQVSNALDFERSETPGKLTVVVPPVTHSDLPFVAGTGSCELYIILIEGIFQNILEIWQTN
jgi:hypothetical protein